LTVDIIPGECISPGTYPPTSSHKPQS
jgi:hypothetical protein